MRRTRGFIAMLLTIVMSLCCFAYAADDIVIDVQDGHMKTGSYNIKLANTDKPISIGLEDGNVIATVLTDKGDTMRVNLGQGRVALTKSANPYVTIQQGSSSSATGSKLGNTGATGTCPACGKSLASGDHTKLRCGHYVCKVGEKHFRVCPYCNDFLCLSTGDHTPCPICGDGLCNHDDTKCYYRHNPAPTPFQTTDPDGKIIYYYLSPDGVFMMGNPNKTKGKVWSPAIEWLRKYHPTPSPIPTATP